MKRMIYIFTSAAICAATALLLISKSSQTEEILLAKGEFCRMDLPDSNPYSIFGAEAVVLMTEFERTGKFTLEVENADRDSPVRKFQLNTRTGIVKLFDKNGDIISEQLLTHEQQTRFLTQDPLAEKYYSISPYAFVANNPLKYVDPDGREIRLAKEYREQFMNDMRNVFGDRADRFSFGDNGRLQLSGKTGDFRRGLSNDQKEVFKGLNKAITDKQITSVVYVNTYELTSNGQTKLVDIMKDEGGGAYSKASNTIIVSPNVGTVTVTLDVPQFVNGMVDFPTQDVRQNTTSVLFHEIGERNTSNKNFRGAVIDYENYARQVIGLPIRPHDLSHSHTIRTNYVK